MNNIFDNLEKSENLAKIVCSFDVSKRLQIKLQWSMYSSLK